LGPLWALGGTRHYRPEPAPVEERAPLQRRLSGGYTLGAPIDAAGDSRRISRVPGIALIAHRRSNRGNADLAVATIEVWYLGLGLGWGLWVCWHATSPCRAGTTVDSGEASNNES